MSESCFKDGDQNRAERGHFFVPLFQRVFVQNSSNENRFDLHERELVGASHFRMNSFEQRSANCNLVI